MTYGFAPSRVFHATAILLLAALATFSPAAAATAEPTPAPPSGPVAPDPMPGPGFEVQEPAEGRFFGSNTGIVIAGTATPGYTVDVLSQGSTLCSLPVESSGDWSCERSLPNGAVELVVRERDGGEVTGEEERTVRVLGAPLVHGSSVFMTRGPVSGTAQPGATVSVRLTGPTTDTTQRCGSADAGGVWTCALTGAEGKYQVRATQTWATTGDDSSDASAPLNVVIDRTAPAAPTVTAPRSGSRIDAGPVEFAGTGEEGAAVEVIAAGRMLCAAFVAGGRWSCVAQAGEGEVTATAQQIDGADNRSASSAPVAVRIGGSAPSATPTPRPTRPAPAPAPAPAPSSPAPVTPLPEATPDGQGVFPPPGTEPPRSDWNAPTRYASALPTLSRMGEPTLWLLGAGAALAFVVFVALPLRLLARAIAPRLPRRPVARLTGRNRIRGVDDDDAVLNPWVVASSVVVGAAALAALASGVEGEVRYLRLVAAIAVGLVVLNVVGIALPARLLGGRAEVGFRLAPTFLLLGAASALLTRWWGIEPPVVIGVLLAAVLGSGIDRRRRGLIGLTQVGSSAAVAVLAWVVDDALVPSAGFWGSLAGEALATVTMAGLSAVVVLLLPVATLPGRAIFDWSPVVWAGTTIAAVTVAAIVLASAVTFPLATVVGSALGFGLLALAVWSWLRWVDPQEA
ncbi:hypothetical protein CLV46_1037 [Diaminobutyricimonas aerilata]|uniref:Bacterial Ig domain-containing protein n=1 Tax=Diaminobutyricimonas aerilata TaxID=1162967 RepID=A0A2M9CHX7_9MICO|nr:hypothetical protein [Diaminobutyricimonas aerilata]PJJ71488.1 hypothetical protein CLV46_1037 [Diaminobutyricimonas aerilata]